MHLCNGRGGLRSSTVWNLFGCHSWALLSMFRWRTNHYVDPTSRCVHTLEQQRGNPTFGLEIRGSTRANPRNFQPLESRKRTTLHKREQPFFVIVGSTSRR